MSCVSRLSYLHEASTSTVGYTILGSTNVLLAIFTIFGNCLILHALRKSQSLHAPTKALYYSLALSDLGVGLVVNPLFAAYCFAVVYNKSELFCNIQGPYAVTGYGLGSVSFLTMTVIALDRFYALKLKLRYRQVITFKRIVLSLAACWTFGFVWPFGWLLSEEMTMITVMIIILCCVVITSISCITTSYGIRYHQQQIHQALAPQQHGGNQFILVQYKKSLNTMIIMFCILFTCYLPYFFVVVAVTMVTTSNSETTMLAFNITSEIIFLNSLLNPVVYCWRIREVRREVSEVLNVLKCFAC